MAPIDVIFTSTFYTKQLNPWPNPSASRVVNYSQLSAYQGICSHLKVAWVLVDIWQVSEKSHRKSSPGNFQYQYLPELLVNVYSYCLMVKSMSYFSVCGSQLFSNLSQLYIYYIAGNIGVELNLVVGELTVCYQILFH